MNKKIYKALCKYFGVKTKDKKCGGRAVTAISRRKIVPHRLMFLPKGMLGADAMIIADHIENELEAFRKAEPIEYHFVDNTNGTTDTAAILEAISIYFDKLVEKRMAVDGNYVSICFLSLNAVPTDAEVSAAMKLRYPYNKYPFNTLDIYKYGTAHRNDVMLVEVDDDEEMKQPNLVKQTSVAEPSISRRVSYGDIPGKVLVSFKNIFELHRGYLPGNASDDLANSTKMKNGHIYVPLKNKDEETVKLCSYVDPSIPLEKLYSKDLRLSLDPTLIHYLIYCYWHRTDKTDRLYTAFMGNYMSKVDDRGYGYETRAEGNNSTAAICQDPTESDIDEILKTELTTLRETAMVMCGHSKLISRKFTICELNGKPVTIAPPAVVMYETQFTNPYNNPMQYEGVIGEYIKKHGYVGVGDLNFIDINEDSPIADRLGNLVTLDPNSNDHAFDQKINAFIARDTNTGTMIVRCYDDSVRRVIYLTLTGNGKKSGNVITAMNSDERLMLTGRDFIFVPDQTTDEPTT